MTLKKVKELAEKATPGPWGVSRSWGMGSPIRVNGPPYTSKKICSGKIFFGHKRTEDAEFIAAANPETVLDLIASLEEVLEILVYYRASTDGSKAHSILSSLHEKWGM